jgi:hypothetical protein
MRSVVRTLTLLTLLSTAPPAAAQVVFSSAGGNAAAVQATVDAFRAALGNPNNGNAPGPLAGGRREINWDGGGSLVTSPAPTPFLGFAVGRGATFTTPGTGFEQNAENFANIDPSYATTFAPFSPVRLFAPIGSNVLDAVFSFPGVGGPAATRGFGVVFSDVDRANTTSLQFFGAGGNSLGTYFAPSLVGSQTFSFLGVTFDNAIVSRVRITTGNVALGAGVTDQNGNERDVVVMDDFFYAEPTAVVPEPATVLLVGAGLALLAVRARRRAR